VSGLGELDTAFRSVIRRLHQADRVMRVRSPINPHLDLPAFVKNRDGDLAIFFERVEGWEVPVCCNLLASRENALVALGVDLHGLRAAVQRAIDHPIPPVEVEKGRCQEVVVTDGIDLGAMFPVPFHMPVDSGRFVTGGIVITAPCMNGPRRRTGGLRSPWSSVRICRCSSRRPAWGRTFPWTGTSWRGRPA